MNALEFRTRIAVLWVAAAVAATGSVLLYLVVPGALEEMLAGEMEGETLDDAAGLGLAALRRPTSPAVAPPSERSRPRERANA